MKGTVPLGEIAEKVVVGHVGPTSEYYRDNGVPFLRTQNVVQGELHLDDVRHVTKEFHDRLKKSQLRENDVVLSRVISDKINCGIIPSNLDGANCANIIVIRPGKNINSSYLKHFIMSPITQRALMKRKVGSAQSVVNTQIVKGWMIPFPPLPEQRRIAAILDKADAIRKNRQETIRLTEEFLRSAFLEMFGDPVTNPKSWPVKKLDSVADIASGVTKGRKFKGKKTVFVPYMRVWNVQDMHIDLSDIQEIEVLPTEIEKYRLEKGDVLLTEGGDPDKLERGAVWQGEIDPCIHQNHIFRVRPRLDIVQPEYLSVFISSPSGKNSFLRAAKQTTGIATINKTQLRNFPLLIPPFELQVKFSKVLNKQMAISERFENRYGVMDELFDALTQRAFRGEL